MGWFTKKLTHHRPYRSNEENPDRHDGTMITLAGQDLAHAVQLYIEQKFDVDAQWVTFEMERTRGKQTAGVQALVKVYERKKTPPDVGKRP